MHVLLRPPYAALGLLAEFGAAVAPASNAKWLRALRARRGIADRFRDFTTHRDPARDLVWFHAPSVGECLLTVPVLRRLRGEAPQLQTAVTWYSPSVEAFAHRLDVDFRDYLPFDTSHGAHIALDALQPSALVFSNLDVWPVLTREAARSGVRLGLISAMLREQSSRRSPLARQLLHDAYARLDLVGAITEADAERLVQLGVRPDAIRVTGDSRFDQAWERAHRPDRPADLLASLASDRPTLVAGSTWPSDQAILTDAWMRVRRDVPRARLIIAPHEPTPEHLEPLATWARGIGLRADTLDAVKDDAADVVLVNRIGVLADLYAAGQVAYVGGGFNAAGVHSVLEPAAHARPVIVGPQARGNAEASRLVAAGGATVADSAEQMARTLTEWLSDPAVATQAAEAAAAEIRTGLGAAERSAALVGELVGGFRGGMRRV